jgi:solute carrier family 8 (sodium/calcium exchanger)
MKQMMFWNPTVANLTLMALGSSAPEILLSCIETIGGLNKCPGELGASTIVGSAAFNLLVISGVSIYAVSEENDTDVERDTTVAVGVKKINDMGVFTITCFFGLFAYIWLFICVRDNAIEPWEAWTTFGMFFVLIILAFIADKINSMKETSPLLDPLMAGQEKKEQFNDFTYKEIVTDLVAE